MSIVMLIWRITIIAYFLSDILINYVFFYVIHQYTYLKRIDSTTTIDDLDTTPPIYMVISYYLVASQFIMLTFLIVWQTVSLINIIRIMGDRLERERARLRILMAAFSFSYMGLTCYYVVQASISLNCTNYNSCIRFIDLMAISFVLFFCDVIPTGVLYWQHFLTSSESLRQLEGAM